MNDIKYPKTLHLPWSQSVSSDDKILTDLSCFLGNEVVVLEKMDGENTGLTRDVIHARSLSGRGLTEKQEWSRSWVKRLWGSIRYQIPLGMKIFGENLFAEHSIRYSDLESYFLVFNILVDDVFLSYEEVCSVCKELGFSMVPLMGIGVWDEDWIKELWNDSLSDFIEGYVVRNSNSFLLEDFEQNVAKFVRENHVQTDEHWTKGEKKKNGVRE